MSLRAEVLLVEKVMRVVLQSNTLQQTGGWDNQHSVFLSNSAQEIAALQTVTLSQNEEVIESIVTERFQVPGTNILQYASDCYSLIRSELGKGWSVSTEQAKQTMHLLQKYLISYTALSVMCDEMFPGQQPGGEGFRVQVDKMKVYIQSGYSTELLKALWEYWAQEDSDFLANLHRQLIQEQSLAFGSISLLDEPINLLNQLQGLINLPGGLEILMTGEWFSNSSMEQEKQTLIGPLFSPHFFPQQSSLNKMPGFPAAPDQLRDRIVNMTQGIRSKGEFQRHLQKFSSNRSQYTESLTNFIKLLIKHDMKRTIEWFGHCCNLSRERSKLGRRLQGAQNTQALSDGFCMNLFDCLLLLCKPFTTLEEAKISKIEPCYFKYDPKQQNNDDTPICTTQNLLLPEQKPYGTISEFYFACAQLFHFGWQNAMMDYFEVLKLLSRLNGQDNPQAKDLFDYYLKLKIIYDGIFMDQGRNLLMLDFCNLTMHLLMRWINLDQFLPIDNAPILGYLPEYLLEDIAEFYNFLCELCPDTIKNLSVGQVVMFAKFITFCTVSNKVISNPYIRAKLVQSFAYIVMINPGVVSQAIQYDQVISNYLLTGMVQYYVDVEFTGSHSQFYDKFTYRHFASKIFQFMWRQEFFRQQTRTLDNDYYFQRLINMLINDTTWCFDEGMNKLAEIKKYQIKLREGQPIDDEEHKNYEGNIKYCGFVMQQANESTQMLVQLSEWHSKLLINEEFGNRIAALLNYFLEMLIGEGSAVRDIENTEQTNYKPDELLGNIVLLYVYIGVNQEFYRLVVQDQRSYNSENLMKAYRTVYKRGLIPYTQVQQFEAFIQTVKQVAQEQQTEEDILGEIPEEFLCPLTCELMRNPVKLPSGHIVDRSSIARALLSDPIDPFTREHCTLEMLEEDLELKSQVEAWLNEKLGRSS